MVMTVMTTYLTLNKASLSRKPILTHSRTWMMTLLMQTKNKRAAAKKQQKIKRKKALKMMKKTKQLKMPKKREKMARRVSRKSNRFKSESPDSTTLQTSMLKESKY